MTTPGIEKLAELAHTYNDEKYRLEVRVIELEQRIRELEELDAANMIACRKLQDRIAKARETLKEAVKRECGTFETRYYYDEIKSALDALEGK